MESGILLPIDHLRYFLRLKAFSCILSISLKTCAVKGQGEHIGSVVQEDLWRSTQHCRQKDPGRMVPALPCPSAKPLSCWPFKTPISHSSGWCGSPDAQGSALGHHVLWLSATLGQRRQTLFSRSRKQMHDPARSSCWSWISSYSFLQTWGHFVKQEASLARIIFHFQWCLILRISTDIRHRLIHPGRQICYTKALSVLS